MKLTYTLAALAATALTANAATIVNYSSGVAPTAGTTGAADPASQGWTFQGGGNVYAWGGDSTIGGWRITDGATANAAFYEQTISASQVTDMATNGWVATWTNTLNNDAVSSGSAGGAPSGVDNYYNSSRQTNNQMWISFGSTSFQLTHGVDANGDFTLSDGTSTFQITNTGTNQMSQELGTGAPLVNQYVTYTLAYDSTSGQATLTDSLGGTHGVVAGGTGLPGGDRIIFGATSGSGQGSTTWNSVNLTTIPEPSSAALIGLGGLALILRRRK